MSAVYFDSEMDDAGRRQALYDGDIFIFSKTAASRALIELARTMLEEVFAPHDPRTIHEHMTAEAVATILAELKPAFIHHPECKKLIPQIMTDHGVDPDKLSLSVLGGNLIIRGEKGRPSINVRAEFHVAERLFGKFKRVINLGVPVNTRQAKAILNNGLLRIRFPKVPNRRGEEVPIEVQAE